MEAADATQPRTQVNLRKAFWTGKACRKTRHPKSNRSPESSEGGRGVNLFRTYPGRSVQIRESGNAQGGNDASVKFAEKSDHFVVARKPAKAGGAKGVMS